MNEQYVFPEKNKLVKYLYSKLDNPTQIKVQKTLYLLYAFYGATYGRLASNTEETEFEDQNYPKELFPAKFEAWRYGPVEADVYRDEKSGCFDTPDEDFTIAKNSAEMNNVIEFSDNIISQTNNIDDFSLVDRTHQDFAWKDKYEPGISHISMENEEIVDEYVKRYI